MMVDEALDPWAGLMLGTVCCRKGMETIAEDGVVGWVESDSDGACEVAGVSRFGGAGTDIFGVVLFSGKNGSSPGGNVILE